MAQTATVNVRIADLQEFTDLIKSVTALVAALTDPSFHFDSLPLEARFALENVTRAMHSLSPADGGDGSGGG